QREDVWSPMMTYDLACNGTIIINGANLQWNRVSYLEPSGTEAEPIPLGHRDPGVIEEYRMVVLFI
ncbi:hypothetical protein AVEN_24743-1, partial [Araneus ventricosus]